MILKPLRAGVNPGIVKSMWIKSVSEDEATGYVARVYRNIRRSWGGVDNVVKAHSPHPEALRAVMTFYNGVMHGEGALSLRRREMIAVTVSSINDCHY